MRSAVITSPCALIKLKKLFWIGKGAIYSAFTYFTESFSLNSFKITERMVIKLTKIFAKNHSVKLVNTL